MIQEDGSIKTARISEEHAFSLYRKNLKIISLISLIAGAVGLIAYIVLSVMLGGEDAAPRWVDAFLVFAVPFTVGLIFYITTVRVHKREKAACCTCECKFYSDCYFYSFKTVLKPTETVEMYFYPDAVFKRENEKYFYVYVISKKNFVAFSKEGLSESELNAVKKCFRLAVSGETAELKNYRKEENNQSEETI